MLFPILYLFSVSSNVWQPQNTCTCVQRYSITIHVKVHGIPNNHFLKPNATNGTSLHRPRIVVISQLECVRARNICNPFGEDERK